MMTQSETYNQVVRIIADVFRTTADQISAATEIEKIENFDSLERLNLFLKIEQDMRVNFDMNQMIAFRTVEDIVTAIQERT